MSIPPTQINEVPRSSVVRRLPRLSEEAKANANFLQFVRRELRHWNEDLKERQREGALYLDWLDWLRPDRDETVADFQLLVRKRIPTLLQLIEKFLAVEQAEEPDLEELLHLQVEYVRFCDAYDQSRLLIIEEIDPKGNLQIY